MISEVCIALFTCFTTRAIHLEIADHLTTRTLEHIFQKFIAVRGKPESITSDNAPQFIALAKNCNIKWKFIAAHAPWKGGVYERLVGLVKNTLRKAIRKKLFTKVELDILISNTIRVIHNRPITQVMLDSAQILRPVDFLIPQFFDRV